MGGTLSDQQKEPYCTQMIELFWFTSDYWTTTLDIIMAISSILWLMLGIQIVYHKHL